MVASNGVLVLNKSWSPVHVCSIPRAISLVFQGMARAVDYDYQVHSFESWRDLSAHVEKNGNDFIHTASFSMLVPEVILLTQYSKVPNISVKLNRRNIFLRDNYTCQYCGDQPGARSLTIDHIVPRSKGGRTNWENVALACRDCNAQKSNLTLGDSGMTLRTKPKKPTWTSMLRGVRSDSGHPLWKQFTDVAYWTTKLDE